MDPALPSPLPPPLDPNERKERLALAREVRTVVNLMVDKVEATLRCGPFQQYFLPHGITPQTLAMQSKYNLAVELKLRE